MGTVMWCIAGLVLSVTFVNLLVISNIGLARYVMTVSNPSRLTFYQEVCWFG